jgi:nucleotide-binding universal stress UspA family protein
MRGKGGGQMIEYPKYKKILFYLLHVIPGNPQEALLERFMPGNVVEQMHNVMKEDVDEKFREHYVNNMEKAINFETITKSGREAEEILKLARQEQMDIIVMGTHGSTGVEYVFFGSVAERVIRRSPFPVFIIPSRKKA